MSATETALTATDDTNVATGDDEQATTLTAEAKATEPDTAQADEGKAAEVGTDADAKADDADAKDAKADEDKAEEAGELDPKAFVLPEGVEMDEGKLEAFTPLAKELGLNQEGAQKLVDFYANTVKELTEQQASAWASEQAKWLETAQGDQEYGGDAFAENAGVARKAIERFGTPELKQLFEGYGLGNHPELVRFAYRVGKAISEDGHIPASATSGGGDRIFNLYPTMRKQ